MFSTIWNISYQLATLSCGHMVLYLKAFLSYILLMAQLGLTHIPIIWSP